MLSPCGLVSVMQRKMGVEGQISQSCAFRIIDPAFAFLDPGLVAGCRARQDWSCIHAMERHEDERKR
ncbi:MAG: hypothetical protein VR71_09520 [Roseovarius sp. BRH_c41]|nr:MAG: hypothetical protein VR71_09520 [Roseovarius sp. BRH_c41]